MLVQSFIIKTRSIPTRDQLDILRRYNAEIGSNPNRTKFNAKMVESDANVLRAMVDFIEYVSVNAEGSHCNC